MAFISIIGDVFIHLKAVLKQVLKRVGRSMSCRKSSVNALWHFGTSNVCKYFVDWFSYFVIYFNSE